MTPEEKLKGADVHVTVYIGTESTTVAKARAERYVRSNFLPDNIRAEFDKTTVKTVSGYQVEVHASVVAETREVTL